MTAQLAYFAVDVIGLFSALLFGAHVLLTSPKQLNARLIALICFNSACAIALARQEYGYWMPEVYQLNVGILRAPFNIARNLTPGLLMVLCHSLFQDEIKLPRWLIVAFGLQVSMETLATWLAPDGNASQYEWMRSLAASLQLLFAGLAVYWTLRGWRTDLVEARRRLRMVFLVILGTFVFMDVLLEKLLIPWDSIATFYVHIALSILGTLLVVFALVATLNSDEPIYVDPFRGEKKPDLSEPEKSAPVENSDAAVAALLRAFRDERVYRDGELSIASLATKLAMPEYRLRKLIHEQLGYRNFNALLHEYRIAEACQDLANPAKSQLPILTIALTVGYNSINPFNRAFREAKGVTPSAFRTQAQAPSAKNLSPILEN